MVSLHLAYIQRLKVRFFPAVRNGSVFRIGKELDWKSGGIYGHAGSSPAAVVRFKKKYLFFFKSVILYIECCAIKVTGTPPVC